MMNWTISQVLGFNGVGGDTEAATKITKIQNKIPQGTKYTKATDGECGYWSRKIVDYPSGTGNTLTEKRNYLAKNGISPQTWQKEGVKVGDVIITDDSKQWGHVVVVNSINPDGTVTVSESNYAQPYMVTHNRKIPITSPPPPPAPIPVPAVGYLGVNGLGYRVPTPEYPA